jgi:hypothetical protein
MATVLEQYTTEDQRLLCDFVGKRLNAKDIHKEIFPVYGGSVCSIKRFNIGGKYFTDEEVETETRKWLRQQSKYFYAAGFDLLVKQWDKCISVGGGYVEK